DIGIRDGRIAALGKLAGAAAARTIDAGDRLVTPGFIDVHSHAAGPLTREGLRDARALVAQGITTTVGNPDGVGRVYLAGLRAELERGGIGVNVDLVSGYGSVRGAVMGNADRAPTADELARMEEIGRQAVAVGAVGLASGLFYARC